MTALELAQFMHDAHLELYLNGVLDSEFVFLPMGWHKTHMNYHGKTIAIAEELLKHVTATEKGSDNNE